MLIVVYKLVLYIGLIKHNIIQLLSKLMFHSNNTCESASPEFIKLNMLVRENNQGIVRNTI